jgi:hypothetical protein
MIKNTTFSFLIMLLFCSFNLVAQSAGPVYIVGRSYYQSPGEAFRNAKDGDRIEVKAGTYNDVGILYANNVTIVGVGVRPVIDAKGIIAEGHGIWVIYGNNTTLDNFEMLNEDNGLRGDAAWDQAAVYLKGNNLTMRNMYIHNNMQGFFNQTNSGNTCNLLFENSVFDYNGDGGGHSHNLYVNHNITNLTMRGVWSRNCNGGHIFKNRAFQSNVQGCMFTDPKGVSLNWFIDYPNGGQHTFVGNIVEHNNTNPGSTMLAFGEDVPNPGPNQLIIAQNTFINDGNGQFLDKLQLVTPTIKQNIFVGLNAPFMAENQVASKSDLENAAGYNYRIAKPNQGTMNYSSCAYADTANTSIRVDSLYGGYSRKTKTSINSIPNSGIKSIPTSADFKLLPNGQIVISSQISQKIDISAYSMLGKQIDHLNVFVSEGIVLASLPEISKFPVGNYLIHFSYGSHSACLNYIKCFD